MRRLVVCLVLLSIIVPGGFLTAKEEKTFHVIVNTSNPTSELTKSEISKLFLKKNKHWKELNEAVLPIDQVVDSPVRKQFSAEIHGRKISAIQAYWQKQIFSGRRVPPEEKRPTSTSWNTWRNTKGRLAMFQKQQTLVFIM